MSDLERAKAELKRQRDKMQDDYTKAAGLINWFRRQREENGWRTIIEQIVRNE